MMNKKKILFIHHCGTKSGAANSLITLISHLDREKFEVHVYCPQGTAFEAFRKVADYIYSIPELPEIQSLSGYPYNYLRLFKFFLLYPRLKSVVAMVLELKPELVHLNELSLTSLAKRLKNKNFKVVIHARIVLDHRVPLLNKIIVRRLKKYSDHVICIDGSVQFPLKSINKSTIVYNSYQFKQNDLNTAAHSNDKFVVLFLANLIGYKGVFDLVEASKSLRDLPNFEIWMAGANSRSDDFFKTMKGKLLSSLGIVPDNKAKIQRLIKDSDLQHVKLLGHIDDITTLIKESSVLIFPSYMDGPSRSIFEAGVFGKPSIISLYNKLEDVVENNKTGLIIDEGRPNQIAEAILRLYNDKAFCKTLGENASQKYLALNNPRKNNTEIEKIFLKIV